MPTLRARRPVRRPTYFVAEDKLRKRWTLVEKKKALTGLRRYGNRNIEAIRARYLPNKTIHEINMFFTQMRNRSRLRPHVPKVKVPIELWTEVVEQLTSGVEDYSTVLGNVMQKIGVNECHDERINREDPDWSLIYSYFTALLNADELPHLGQIEAGVVLDLLDSMSRHLTELEVTSQRRLAEMKYKLLSTRVDPRDKKQVYNLAYQALENDLNGNNSTVLTGGSQRDTSATSSADPTQSTSSRPADGINSGGLATDGGERPETDPTASTSTSSADPTPSTSSRPADGVDSGGPATDGGERPETDPTPFTRTSSADPTPSTSSMPADGVDSGSPAAGAKRPETYLLKPVLAPLYSINPLCIPVKYLGLRQPTSDHS